MDRGSDPTSITLRILKDPNTHETIINSLDIDTLLSLWNFLNPKVKEINKALKVRRQRHKRARKAFRKHTLQCNYCALMEVEDKPPQPLAHCPKGKEILLRLER